MREEQAAGPRSECLAVEGSVMGGPERRVNDLGGSGGGQALGLGDAVADLGQQLPAGLADVSRSVGDEGDEGHIQTAQHLSVLFVLGLFAVDDRLAGNELVSKVPEAGRITLRETGSNGNVDHAGAAVAETVQENVGGPHLGTGVRNKLGTLVRGQASKSRKVGDDLLEAQVPVMGIMTAQVRGVAQPRAVLCATGTAIPKHRGAWDVGAR